VQYVADMEYRRLRTAEVLNHKTPAPTATALASAATAAGIPCRASDVEDAYPTPASSMLFRPYMPAAVREDLCRAAGMAFDFEFLRWIPRGTLLHVPMSAAEIEAAQEFLADAGVGPRDQSIPDVLKKVLPVWGEPEGVLSARKPLDIVRWWLDTAVYGVADRGDTLVNRGVQDVSWSDMPTSGLRRSFLSSRVGPIPLPQVILRREVRMPFDCVVL
jgi:hypothetical protein